ncbi:Shikimate kinase 2 [Novipirellula galeiformis]|uniref:Shikimate kinase n=2 Tax=Novipirellula galeiformis TaxID=2528004 RepID=A0A5C6BZC7_9BACT|nr:Shikimate kinase 2 [Novipirellula galeiformis]
MGREMIDLDARVQAHAGRSIREIFQDSGETGFRDLESEMLRVVAAESPAVVSLGGGAILRAENRAILRASGNCIWLVATAETLANRIAADVATTANRPALTSLGVLDEIRQMLETRQPLYADAADLSIDTSAKSIKQVSDEIVRVCRDRSWC